MRGISIWKEGSRLLKKCFVVSNKAGAIVRPHIVTLSLLAILSLFLLTTLGLPRNCGQSEKLLNKQKEDCHGIQKEL